MKKVSILTFVAIASFLSFGFVLFSEPNEDSVKIENIQAVEQADELEPAQDSNEDIW